jgi:transposase-like protein
VCGQVPAFVPLEDELEAALGGDRCARDLAAKGHRNGHRGRRLDMTFGPLVLALPPARLADGDAGEREWKSVLPLACRRLSRRAELLIAEAHLAGVNTRLRRNFCSRIEAFGYGGSSLGLSLTLKGTRHAEHYRLV